MKKLLKKILDFKKIKEDNIILRKRVKELEEERQPLIELKNKYLSDLRCKNLENGRLKKRIEELKETITNLYEKIEYKNILGDKEWVLY